MSNDRGEASVTRGCAGSGAPVAAAATAPRADEPASTANLQLGPSDEVVWRCEHCGEEIEEPVVERPLSKQQLAHFFGYSTKWVENMVNEGMPFLPVGGRKLFVRSRCLKWLWLRNHYRRCQRQ